MKNHIIEREWTTAAGLPAVAVICIREDGSKSHRCGYVGCPKHHSWQPHEYPDFDVYGGVTWSDNRLPFEHPSVSAEYWLGFDCLHYGDRDIEPYMGTGRHWFPDGKVRDLDYVIENCESLAKQICQQSKQAPVS